ncbi:MAG: universal stress protein [Pseudomonadota bacterium]
MAMKFVVPLNGEIERHPFNTFDDSALMSAFLLARRVRGHIEAFCTRPAPSKAWQWLSKTVATTRQGENAPGIVPNTDKKSRKAFERIMNVSDYFSVPVNQTKPLGAKCSASFLTQPNEDFFSASVAQRGRLADVIVIGKNDPFQMAIWPNELQQALYETASPVLICPSSLPKKVGKRIMLAWNGSIASSFAATVSIEVMQAAKAVTVVHYQEKADNTPRLEDLMSYLKLHDVDAQLRLLDKPSNGLASALLRQADACRADMIIIGSTQRSRINQLFFGSIFYEVVQKAKIPVLLCRS